MFQVWDLVQYTGELQRAQVLLELCCFWKLKRVQIPDFVCRSSWDVFRENDHVFFMFAYQRIERNVTASDMPVLCDS